MDLRESTLIENNRHPWELARLDFFSRTFRSLCSEMKDLDILDVGSGDAWFAHQLIQRHPNLIRSITCWDAHYTPDMIRTVARDPRIRATQHAPTGSRFHCLLLLDCLEHIENDSEFLTSVTENHLVPGGHIVISVPAWQFLFSDHDRFLLHFRRYSPHQGKHLIEKTGLTLIKSGGLFHSLLIPRTLAVCLEKLQKKPLSTQPLSQWKSGKLLTRMVLSVLWLDSLISRSLARVGIELPGLSWWATCKKPS